MPILKSVTAANTTTNEFHVVRWIDIKLPGNNTAMVSVASYPTEAVYNDGGSPLDTGRFDMPLELIAGPIVDSIEQWLLANADGPYLGGTIVPDRSTGLEAAQVRKWAAVKVRREAVFDAPLVTPFGTFDSDANGRASIKDGVLLAMYATSTGSPNAPRRFTLANNDRITLTAADMLLVGQLLGAKVQAAYDTGDALRAAIYAPDATPASVAAVAWPASAP